MPLSHPCAPVTPPPIHQTARPATADTKNHPASNPTLSYTQRLEKRIKELEDQLASSSRSPPSITVSAHSSPSTASTGLNDGRSPPKSHADEQSFTRSFSGLKVDDKGRITFGNGASANERPANPNSNGVYASAELDQSIRERLVANAMQQRALETFSGTPVRSVSRPSSACLSKCY